jgi:hypothetical protein
MDSGKDGALHLFVRREDLTDVTAAMADLIVRYRT